MSVNPLTMTEALAGQPPERMFWCPGEPEGRRAAVVCARGHVITAVLDVVPGPLGTVYGYCDKDGTALLARCVTCAIRIKGDRPPNRLATYAAYELPSFCDCCGEPHPWASREDRLTRLQHIASTEPDPDRRKAVLSALEQLKREGLRGRREAKLWKTVQEYAPEVIVQGWEVARPLLSAFVKKKLGLDSKDSFIPKK